VGLFFAQIFETPQSMLHRLWGYFLPKNKYHYSLLLFRMAARFRASRYDRAAAKFRVKPLNQHPMMSWLTHLLPVDVGRQIYQDHIFPEVSHCSLCLYHYSYFLFIRFWIKYVLLNAMRMSPFGLSDILGRSLMMTSPS
jgi:hypothetical protein